jgi:hypothetical protein
MIYLKLLEKLEQEKTQNKQKKIIKIRAEIKEIETKKYKESMKKSWFFENINKIDRPLANLTKLRGEKTKISKMRNAKGEKTTSTMEMQGIITDYFENLYSNKFENLQEIDKFLILMTIQY